MSNPLSAASVQNSGDAKAALPRRAKVLCPAYGACVVLCVVFAAVVAAAKLLPQEEETKHPDKTRKEDFVHSLHGDQVENNGKLPTIDPDSLLNRTFITSPDADGEQDRAKIISIEPTDKCAADTKQCLFKFRCEAGSKRYEEILTYN